MESENKINVPQQELNRIIAKAKHAIGYEPYRVYTRYGEKYFLVSRNYYTISEEVHNPDWEWMEKLGYAEERSPYTFVLTPKGISWISQLLGVHIYSEKEKDQPYPIDIEEEEEIFLIWDWCKKHNAFVFRHYTTRDVLILLEEDNLRSFCDTLQDAEGGDIPSRVTAYGVAVSFFDMLPFRVTADQIWDRRPKNMREEL